MNQISYSFTEKKIFKYNSGINSILVTIGSAKNIPE